MTIANINAETGIAYGVIDARLIPYLYDDIVTQGNNLTYESARDELRASIQSAIDDAETIDDLRASLLGVADWGHAFRPEELVQGLELDDYESLDDARDSIDVESLVDECLECWECDECEYSYSDENGKYLLGYLGGAPLIWVIESRFRTYARQCSPCVPNAGDMDNMTSANDGHLCYCVDPRDILPDCDDDERRGHTPDVLEFDRLTAKELDEVCESCELSCDEMSATIDDSSVKVYDDRFSGDSWFVCGHEYGAEWIIRADSECSAYEIWVDESPTIPQSEIHEAYGAFDKLLERMESRGYANDYALRSFCNRWARFYFDVDTRDANRTGAWDRWELTEGYQYQSNASGTGIVETGHYEWIRELSDCDSVALFSGSMS